MFARFRRQATLVLLASAFAACGGGDGTTAPKQAAVSSVAVSLASSSAVIGSTVQATAVTKDASGATLTGRTVTWTSSNTAVATIASTGLATAVAAGTANIIATSEGVTGQAVLTVNPPAPQLTGMTLSDPNGGALDVSKLAGIVRLNFNLQATTGTSGVVVARIDGVEIGRQNVTATLVLPAEELPGQAASMMVPVVFDVNVSPVTYTVTNGQVQALPLARNGNRVLSLDFLPTLTSTPAATTQANVTLSTPDVFTGRFSRTGTLTNIGGNDWSSSDMSIELIPIQFGANAPTSAVLRAADYKTDFGNTALSSVVDLATKTSADIATPTLLPKSTFAFESKLQFGSRTYLGDYAFGTVHATPQSAEPNLNGNCVYTAGTGFISSGAVTLPALPSGCTRWVNITPLPSTYSQLPYMNTYGRWWHDTKGPTGAAGAFTLATRPTVANQSAYGSFGTYGVADSWIGRSYDFGLGLDKSKLSDGGVGLNLSQTFEYHFGNTATFTPSTSSLFTNPDLLPETGGLRASYFKLGARDLLGNLGYVPLTTSAGNDFTTGGMTSTNLGVDAALVGVNRTSGFASYSGPASGFVVRGGLGGLSWGASLTGSSSGYSTNASTWSRVYRDLDPTKSVIGEGASTQIPWWQAGSGGASASTSLSYSTMISQSVSRYGGTGEGLYTAMFGAVDRGGNVPSGSPWGPINTLYDFTSPTIPTLTGNGPFVSGSNATISIAAADNVGLSWYSVGPIFDYPNAGFTGGNAYVVPGQIPIGGSFGGPLVKTWNQDITNLVPNGMVFYDPIGGSISNTVNKTIGVAGYSRDWAWNESPVAIKTFTNNGSFTVPSDPVAIRFAIGTTTACNGLQCASGAQKDMSVTASWDSPSATSPINKWELYALSQDGRVHFLKTAPAAVRTTISGNLFRYSTTFPYDWNEYCSAVGALQMIGLLQSINRLYWYKNSVFFNLSLQAPMSPNTYCQAAHVR